MADTIRIAISIQKALFDQVESLIRQFNLSRSDFVGMAMEHFIRDYQDQALLDAIHQATGKQPGSNPEAAARRRDGCKVINQGDVYWVPLEAANGSEPGFTHPHVVIQENVITHSRINTVVVCALSTNMKRAKAPGNVLLEAGEANLPRQSVVVVSQVSSVDKAQLGEYIGALSPQRVSQVLSGMRFLQLMADAREAGHPA